MILWESLGRNWMQQKLPVVLQLLFSGLYGYVCPFLVLETSCSYRLINLYNEFLHFCFCSRKLTKIQRSGYLQNVRV